MTSIEKGGEEDVAVAFKKKKKKKKSSSSSIRNNKRKKNEEEEENEDDDNVSMRLQKAKERLNERQEMSKVGQSKGVDSEVLLLGDTKE
jgi:hypothetical protein